MIAGHAYPLTLTFSEAVLLGNGNSSMAALTDGADFMASAHGVTILFPSEKAQQEAWNRVVLAIDDNEEE